MAANKSKMQPLSINRNVHYSRKPISMPPVPVAVSDSPMAPDRMGPTEGNGHGIPPTELHVALLIPSIKYYKFLKNRVQVLTPPYWEGTVELHMIVVDHTSEWDNVNPIIRQALVDSGLADAEQVKFTTTLGYPNEPS